MDGHCSGYSAWLLDGRYSGYRSEHIGGGGRYVISCSWYGGSHTICSLWFCVGACSSYHRYIYQYCVHCHYHHFIVIYDCYHSWGVLLGSTNRSVATPQRRTDRGNTIQENYILYNIQHRVHTLLYKPMHLPYINEHKVCRTMYM